MQKPIKKDFVIQRTGFRNVLRVVVADKVTSGLREAMGYFGKIVPAGRDDTINLQVSPLFDVDEVFAYIEEILPDMTKKGDLT